VARAHRRRATPGRRASFPATDLYDGQMAMIIAHIAGIPVEETLAMAVPVLGAAYAGIIASLRARRRRGFNKRR
jgi:hypothetical protein